MDEELATADVAGLLRFLEQKVLPTYTQRRTELNNQPLIRAQAFGEAFIRISARAWPAPGEEVDQRQRR